MRKCLLIVLMVAMIAVPALAADDKPEKHQFDSNGPWCIQTDYSWLGATYDPALSHWAWFANGEVMFLHVTPPKKRPSVRLLGAQVGLSVSSAYGSGGLTPMVMLVPIRVEGFSFGVTPYKVKHRNAKPGSSSGVLFSVTYHGR